MEQNRERLFDTRVVERNIAAGIVSREEYEAWLAALPDSADTGLEAHARMVFTRIPGLNEASETLDEKGDQG